MSQGFAYFSGRDEFPACAGGEGYAGAGQCALEGVPRGVLHKAECIPSGVRFSTTLHCLGFKGSWEVAESFQNESYVTFLVLLEFRHSQVANL